MQEKERDETVFGGWAVRALVALIVLCAAIAAAAYFVEERRADERAAEHQRRAEETFSPVLSALRDAEEAEDAADLPVDVDRTIRVLHEIDLALQNAGSIEEYVALLGKQDYRGVAPAVLKARKEILDLLFRLYAAEADLEDQEAVWGLARRWMGLLTFTKAVELEGGFSVSSPLGGASTPSVSVDTRKMLEELEGAEESRGELVETVRDLQNELVEATTRHSKMYWDVIDEWDRLCLNRDRAYLAAYSRDWAAALESADAAIAMAPGEKEAHLLKALAMIEGGLTQGGERDEVGELLADYVRMHPGSSAPALLLQGVNLARRGEVEEARLLLEQAAAYYPRQAEGLAELLDPYRMRSRYLRKSRSGNSIRELYKSTMLGACWFSPELQLAKLDFEAGDFEAGSKRVMDHFSRRRAQGQWDLVLYDITFCEELLGDYYPLIFPEDVYLDLKLDPTFFGGDLKVAVHNRSDRTLHNATVILCVQFTDMHQDDYETFPSQTQPVLPAHSTTDFGTVEVAMELFGAEKGREDVYARRAIVVSNEAVLWIDTVDAKLEPRVIKGLPELKPSLLFERALAALDRDVSLEIAPERFFDDDVVIRLPREIALLKPVFRLRHGAERLPPAKNEIDGGSIRLVFDGVDEFEGTPTEELVLEVHGALGSVDLRWTPVPGEGFKFAGVERGE